MNIATALQHAADKGAPDAKWLLAKVLDVAPSYLYCHPEQNLTAQQAAEFAQLLKRHQQGEPTAYILGSQEFWQHRFVVNRATLIPRADTELLVALALGLPEPIGSVLELGTGSGCIAISIGAARPEAMILATDKSLDALKIAKLNAGNIGVKNIQFIQSDWFEKIDRSFNFAVIISNPPYIAADDPHLAALGYEPQSALVAADNGLADLRHIIDHSRDFLAENGTLLLEFGYQQSAAVGDLLTKAGYKNIQMHRDLAGHIRAASAQYRGATCAKR